ncbi:uncharacterized protein EHS24_008065 [Apiotrichum porosum]|uniref:Uncharacterized protein n=1 Tax=Apiotrichum porosum TaxID=105984 RepID=A0A427XSQ6_9TREE|nr:uncharacterized protein EHS24_008065 [Apiotrichum porosum]RSH81870.1 hypothetical protein EHS24_008065 [Apiotrichum porosum]
MNATSRLICPLPRRVAQLKGAQDIKVAPARLYIKKGNPLPPSKLHLQQVADTTTKRKTLAEDPATNKHVRFDTDPGVKLVAGQFKKVLVLEDEKKVSIKGLLRKGKSSGGVAEVDVDKETYTHYKIARKSLIRGDVLDPKFFAPKVPRKHTRQRRTVRGLPH